MTVSRVLAVLRRLVASFTGAVVLLIALPAAAFADIGDKGSPQPLTDLDKVLLFIGIPVAVLVISLAVFMRPGSGGARRYRPMRGWDADDAWFGLKPPVAGGQAQVSSGEDTGGSRGSW